MNSGIPNPYKRKYIDMIEKGQNSSPEKLMMHGIFVPVVDDTTFDRPQSDLRQDLAGTAAARRLHYINYLNWCGRVPVSKTHTINRVAVQVMVHRMEQLENELSRKLEVQVKFKSNLESSEDKVERFISDQALIISDLQYHHTNQVGMVAQVTIAKRRLTRFCNKLDQALQRSREEKLDSLQVNTEDLSSKVNLGNLCRLEEAVGTVETVSSQVEKALGDFLSLDGAGEESDPNDTEQYVTRAEDCLSSALEYIALLQGRIQALKSLETLRLRQTTQSAALPNVVLNQFNYLLNALDGEARESVKKFHVTPENYSRAVSFLQARYGNPEELIQKLEKPQQAQVVDLKKTPTRTKRDVKTTQKVNVVAGEERLEESETAILQVQSTKEIHSTTFLPIGEIQVVDNKKGNLRSVPVLLDTGAEISFIENTLAEELQLTTISQKVLLLHTFGSEKIQKKICRIVQVQVRDIEGKYHELELVTHDVLTRPMRCPPLLEEDLQFIKSLNLSVTYGRKGKQIQPLILLGCDQVWKFWKTDQTPVSLPSGLHLLPTKTGNLITGRHLDSRQVLEIQTSEEVDKWDKYWSLEAQMNRKHITSPWTTRVFEILHLTLKKP
ncbi:Tas retrotransposon peptidase A16 [Ostertagia ostertagi]